MGLLIKYWRYGIAILLAIAVVGIGFSIRNAYADRERLKIEAQAREDYIEELQAQQQAIKKNQQIKVKNEQVVKGKSHTELVTILAGKQWLRHD